MKNFLRNVLSKNNAARGFLAITFIALFYHALIISGIVPSKYVWGGRLTTVSQLYVFEAISVLVQVFMGLVVYVSTWGKYSKRFERFFVIALYAISALLLLNTIGNLFAAQLLETVIFTPLTLLGSIFAFRLAIGDR